MQVERILVRLMADSSHYFAAFSKAENKLSSFGGNIARIQEKYNRAVETANARHMNAIENAAHRQNQIVRLASRNFDFATRTYERQHQQSMDRATQRQVRMNQSSDRLRQQEISSARKSFQTAQMDADRFLEASNRKMKQMTMGGGIIDREFNRTELLARRRFNRASAFAQRRMDGPVDPMTGLATPGSLTNKGMQTVQFAQSRYNAVMQLAEERKKADRDKAFDANTADLQRYARMMRSASGKQLLAVQEANQRHAQSVTAAQDQLNRSTARADKLKDNASIKSVEARNKAVEQANLRFQNAVRNADFRRDMTTKAAGLQLKDDKANAALKNKMEAVRHSEELRDRLSHDLRIVSYAATAAFGFIAYEAIKLGASFQKAGIELEVMTGNATVAQQLLKDIQTLAIESPFQTSDLVQSAKQVKAFGFETSQIIPILSRLGDVSSGTGADMDRVILAFGQVRTTGRLMGQELRQFTNAGIPILEYLAKVMGVTEQQMPNLVRQGKVSFGDVAKAFNMMTDSGGIFNGMMERINKETIHGRWQNFKENLQLAAIQLGLGAFEGLKLNEVLTNLADNVRGMDQSRVAGFFSNFRKGAELLWTVVKRLWEGLTDFLSSINITSAGIKSWYERNQRLVNTLGMVLAHLVVFNVALRLSILVVRILILSLGVLKTVFLSMTAVAFIWGTLTTLFWGTHAAILGMVSALQWFVLLSNPAILAVGLLAGAFVLLLSQSKDFENFFGNAFKNFGGHFVEGFNNIKSAAMEAWPAIVDAFKAGDIIGVFDTVWTGVQFGFKQLLVSMKAELRDFLIEFVFGALGELSVMGVRMEKAVVLKAKELLADQQEVERSRRTYDNLIQAGLNRWNADKQQQLNISRQMKETELKSIVAPAKSQFLQTALETRVNAAMPTETAKNIFKDIVMPSEVWKGDIEGPGGLIDWFQKQHAMPPQTPTKGLAALGGMPGLEAVQSSYSEIWKKAFEGAQAVYHFGREGKWDSKEMKDAIEHTKVWTESLDKLATSLVGVERTTKAAIYPIESYPEHVTHLVRELGKEIEDGITPMDKYTKSMNALNMAFEGKPIAAADNPMRGMASPFGSVMGAYAPYVQSKLLPLIDKSVYDVGSFKEFEKLRNATHDRRSEGTPAMLFGSREAANTIARNNQQALSVQEQVLQTLRDAAEVEKGTRDYTKRVGDVLESMRGDKGNQEGGWSIFQGFRKGQ